MRLRVRILLILELLVGVAPVTALYIYMFPAGTFWTRRAMGAAVRGAPNTFTLCVEAAFLAGGVGLVSLWLAVLRRLLGRGAHGPLVLTGIFAGIASSVFLLTVATILGAMWLDYFLYGTPVLVAVHQIIFFARSRRPLQNVAPPPS